MSHIAVSTVVNKTDHAVNRAVLHQSPFRCLACPEKHFLSELDLQKHINGKPHKTRMNYLSNQQNSSKSSILSFTKPSISFTSSFVPPVPLQNSNSTFNSLSSEVARSSDAHSDEDSDTEYEINEADLLKCPFNSELLQGSIEHLVNPADPDMDDYVTARWCPFCCYKAPDLEMSMLSHIHQQQHTDSKLACERYFRRGKQIGFKDALKAAKLSLRQKDELLLTYRITQFSSDQLFNPLSVVTDPVVETQHSSSPTHTFCQAVCSLPLRSDTLMVQHSSPIFENSSNSLQIGKSFGINPFGVLSKESEVDGTISDNLVSKSMTDSSCVGHALKDAKTDTGLNIDSDANDVNISIHGASFEFDDDSNDFYNPNDDDDHFMDSVYFRK